MRGQGAKNSIQSFRDALYALDFQEFKASLNDSYPIYLDKLTNTILKNITDQSGLQWGAIRKGLNLVFRDVFYSHFMFETY